MPRILPASGCRDGQDGTGLLESLQKKPLYLRIACEIRGKIQSGEWEQGDKLPREEDLAEKLGVCRTTLREAVSFLVNQGLLERRRGIGTFVARAGEIAGGLETLISVTKWIEKQGYRPGTKSIELTRKRPLTSWENTIFRGWHLKLAGEIRRIRTADNIPVLYCVDVLPDSLMPEKPGQLNESLFDYLEQYWKQTVILAHSTITITQSTDELSQKLAIPSGTPLLVLQQVHYNQDKIPILISQDHFVAHRFKFDVIRFRY